LRVANRRLTQCLQVFSGSLHTGRAAKIRKKLKRLMDRCAEVRNCDIVLKLLDTVGVSQRSGAARDLKQRRKDTERALLKELRRWRGRSLAKAWSEELFSPEAVDVAFIPDLGAWIKEWFAHGRLAAQPDAAHQAVHQFRLEGKRLRYTIELLGPLYGEGSANVLDALREAQTSLGELNDCVTALDLLDGHARAARAIRELLRQREEAFRVLWKEKFGKRRQTEWTSIFSGTAKPNPAARPSRKPAGRSQTRGAAMSAA
jgi:CHAD domain-containing protein